MSTGPINPQDLAPNPDVDSFWLLRRLQRRQAEATIADTLGNCPASYSEIESAWLPRRERSAAEAIAAEAKSTEFEFPRRDPTALQPGGSGWDLLMLLVRLRSWLRSNGSISAELAIELARSMPDCWDQRRGHLLDAVTSAWVVAQDQNGNTEAQDDLTDKLDALEAALFYDQLDVCEYGESLRDWGERFLKKIEGAAPEDLPPLLFGFLAWVSRQQESALAHFALLPPDQQEEAMRSLRKKLGENEMRKPPAHERCAQTTNQTQPQEGETDNA